jgi:hypothetical protein
MATKRKFNNSEFIDALASYGEGHGDLELLKSMRAIDRAHERAAKGAIMRYADATLRKAEDHSHVIPLAFSKEQMELGSGHYKGKFDLVTEWLECMTKCASEAAADFQYTTSDPLRGLTVPVTVCLVLGCLVRAKTAMEVFVMPAREQARAALESLVEKLGAGTGRRTWDQFVSDKHIKNYNKMNIGDRGFAEACRLMKCTCASLDALQHLSGAGETQVVRDMLKAYQPASILEAAKLLAKDLDTFWITGTSRKVSMHHWFTHGLYESCAVLRAIGELSNMYLALPSISPRKKNLAMHAIEARRIKNVDRQRKEWQRKTEENKGKKTKTKDQKKQMRLDMPRDQPGRYDHHAVDMARWTRIMEVASVLDQSIRLFVESPGDLLPHEYAMVIAEFYSTSNSLSKCHENGTGANFLWDAGRAQRDAVLRRLSRSGLSVDAADVAAVRQVMEDKGKAAVERLHGVIAKGKSDLAKGDSHPRDLIKTLVISCSFAIAFYVMHDLFRRIAAGQAPQVSNKSEKKRKSVPEEEDNVPIICGLFKDMHEIMSHHGPDLNLEDGSGWYKSLTVRAWPGQLKPKQLKFF